MGLIDYFSTWFISDDELAMRREVAEAQQVALDRRFENSGREDFVRYLGLSNDIQAGGDMQADYRKKHDNPLRVVPWWLWLVGAVVVLWYSGVWKKLWRKLKPAK